MATNTSKQVKYHQHVCIIKTCSCVGQPLSASAAYPPLVLHTLVHHSCHSLRSCQNTLTSVQSHARALAARCCCHCFLGCGVLAWSTVEVVGSSAVCHSRLSTTLTIDCGQNTTIKKAVVLNLSATSCKLEACVECVCCCAMWLNVSAAV